MKCNPIPEREDWFITDRKPTICPRSGKKEVRKALALPTTVNAGIVDAEIKGLGWGPNDQ